MHYGENDLSAVALVTGNVKYPRRACSPFFNISFWFKVLVIVLTFVTLCTWTTVSEKTVWMASGSIWSWTLKRGKSILLLRYSATTSIIFCTWFPFADSMRGDSKSPTKAIKVGLNKTLLNFAVRQIKCCKVCLPIFVFGTCKTMRWCPIVHRRVSPVAFGSE